VEIAKSAGFNSPQLATGKFIKTERSDIHSAFGGSIFNFQFRLVRVRGATKS